MEANAIEIYSDILVVLGTAGVVVPLLQRWGVSPILGYLGAGMILGPFGLGSLIQNFPFLYWFTIVDAQNVTGFGDLGVVFLLFLIGLELSFRRLMTMRRLVFGLGGLQIVITATLLTGAAFEAGLSPISAAIIGISLSLSSTAVVLELFSSQGRLTTMAGRVSFSVLLAQDLAIIPILVFISVISSRSDAWMGSSLAASLGKSAVAIGVIILFGRFLLRPLFRLVANAQSAEMFIAAALFVIIAAGLIASEAGLSMALGAFVIALMLAETEYGKAIQVAIGPLKGLLLGIFFFAVGMKVDFREFVREPLWLLIAVIGLVVLKAAILSGLSRGFGIPWPAALESGLLLGPGGEFAFVSIGLAASAQLVPSRTASFALAWTAVTMVLTPLLSVAARRLLRSQARGPILDSHLSTQPPGGEQHAIVVGYGRVGKVVCSLLKQHDVKFIALDNDADGVARDRRRGDPVYYGDASDMRFLQVAGLSQATGLIITINSHKVIAAIVERVRSIRPDIVVISRARDQRHASHLYSLGATDAVPETIEASLQLSEAALINLGLPTGPVIASIHEKRDEFRRALQAAAKQAGLDASRAVRRKTLSEL